MLPWKLTRCNAEASSSPCIHASFLFSSFCSALSLSILYGYYIQPKSPCHTPSRTKARAGANHAPGPLASPLCRSRFGPLSCGRRLLRLARATRQKGLNPSTARDTSSCSSSRLHCAMGAQDPTMLACAMLALCLHPFRPSSSRAWRRAEERQASWYLRERRAPCAPAPLLDGDGGKMLRVVLFHDDALPIKAASTTNPSPAEPLRYDSDGAVPRYIRSTCSQVRCPCIRTCPQVPCPRCPNPSTPPLRPARTHTPPIYSRRLAPLAQFSPLACSLARPPLGLCVHRQPSSAHLIRLDTRLCTRTPPTASWDEASSLLLSLLPPSHGPPCTASSRALFADGPG